MVQEVGLSQRDSTHCISLNRSNLHLVQSYRTLLFPRVLHSIKICKITWHWIHKYFASLSVNLLHLFHMWISYTSAIARRYDSSKSKTPCTCDNVCYSSSIYVFVYLCTNHKDIKNLKLYRNILYNFTRVWRHGKTKLNESHQARDICLMWPHQTNIQFVYGIH